MTHYSLTSEGQADILDIRRFTVENWGQSQSNKYLAALRQTLRLLAETPSLGILRPDVGVDVRSFPHVSHVIYYFMKEQQIVVFGVLHKRMVPTLHLNDRAPSLPVEPL